VTKDRTGHPLRSLIAKGPKWIRTEVARDRSGCTPLSATRRQLRPCDQVDESKTVACGRDQGLRNLSLFTQHGMDHA